MGWCQYGGFGEAVDIARWRTLPTAASPRSTSLTLLLGLGALGAGESDIVGQGCRDRWRRVGPEAGQMSAALCTAGVLRYGIIGRGFAVSGVWAKADRAI